MSIQGDATRIRFESSGPAAGAGRGDALHIGIGLAVALLAIAIGGHLMYAQGVLKVTDTCTNPGSSNMQVPVGVPCSNTVNCMSYSYNDRMCGANVVVNDKNTNVPNAWSGCQAISDPSKSCEYTPTKCGTVVWYSGPCTRDSTICTPSTGVDGTWCKAPDIPN